jgi:hypothetical protein|tara:strand:- start:76 stop:264 length:189 start_codon:yes stop_codon:yes gene_type:complete
MNNNEKHIVATTLDSDGKILAKYEFLNYKSCEEFLSSFRLEDGQIDPSIEIESIVIEEVENA